jgi:hypothetical protein
VLLQNETQTNLFNIVQLQQSSIKDHSLLAHTITKSSILIGYSIMEHCVKADFHSVQNQCAIDFLRSLSFAIYKQSSGTNLISCSQARREGGGGDCPGPPALGAPSHFLRGPNNFFGRNISVFSGKVPKFGMVKVVESATKAIKTLLSVFY